MARIEDTVEFAGGVKKAYRTITSSASPYTLKDDDYILFADTTSGNITILLPAVASDAAEQGRAAREVVIAKMAAANSVTVDASGAETINGATTQVLTAQYHALKIACNGTVWVGLDGVDPLSGSNLALSGTLSVGSTATVTGAATLSSTLAVTGASTLTGDVTCAGDLTVDLTSTLTGNVTCSGTLGVTGAATLTSAVATGEVSARSLRATGDEGTGAAGTVQFCDVVVAADDTAAAAIGNSPINGSGGAFAGWLKVYNGTTVCYVPMWTAV